MSEERRINLDKLQPRNELAEEHARLQGWVNEMSLLVGMLRGMIERYNLSQDQAELLVIVDKAINRLFYSGTFKEKA